MSNTGYSIYTNGDINLISNGTTNAINIDAKSCNMNADVFFNNNVEFNSGTLFGNVLDKLTGISSLTPSDGDTFVYNSGAFITTKNGIYISPLLIAEDTTISGNYNIYNVDTRSGPIVITLPTISPLITYNITIIDTYGNAGTNNITINVGNVDDEKINGIYTSVQLNINYSVLKLIAVLENIWIIS
jgi:hypothetical protein